MKSDHDNPTNYIFEEMDKLADKITEALLPEGHDPEDMKCEIKRELDEWVKKKVVRFNLDMPLFNEEYKEAESDQNCKIAFARNVAAKMIDDMLKMSSNIQLVDKTKRIDVTFYIVAFKENF